MTEGELPICAAPTILPLAYGVNSGPLREFPDRGPKGVRNILNNCWLKLEVKKKNASRNANLRISAEYYGRLMGHLSL